MRTIPEFRLYLFDLDGTLYRSTSILYEAYRTGIRQYRNETGHNLEIPDKQAVMDEVGNPVDEIYRNLFGEVERGRMDVLSTRIQDALLEYIQQGGGELLEGVPETLRSLSEQNSLGLVTNARREYMDVVADYYDLATFFERMRCIEDIESDQKAELVRGMLEYFDVPPEETLLVGDRESDYVAAQENNVHFVLRESEYGEDEFVSDVQCVSDLRELLPAPKNN
ncbi:MAG: HAD family hydrolase [bacterium]